VGMPNIVFRCQMFRGDFDQVWSQLRMLHLMEALCRVNQTHLQQMEAFRQRGLVKRGYPSVYRSGLHYETEKGTEIWPDVPSLISGTMGTGRYPGPWGDCEDLACYRVAELRELPFHYERQAPWDRKVTEVADPRYPQARAYSPSDALPIQVPVSGPEDLKPDPAWAGWRRVPGGIKSKPFAKWRRGPTGNYHYHALTFLPDGRLEDPSLVLGMGREADFARAGTAQALFRGAPVVLQYAKPPEVMVVDPEKPSGYGGGVAPKLDAKVLAELRKSGVEGQEVGAYLSNEVVASDGELDVDELVGWSRDHKLFLPRGEDDELARMLGYGGE